MSSPSNEVEYGLSVFGLGYVGCVSAVCLARAGRAVIGVDINPTKVDAINRAMSPIVEAGLDEAVREAVGRGRLQATSDGDTAVSRSRISLICVGTPSKPNGDLDLTFIERVCQEIGSALRGKRDRHTIVVRSTVLPGTTESMVVPILEQSSGRKVNEGFTVCVNPEFLREGTSLLDFYEPPFTLIGSPDPIVARDVATLYADVRAPLWVTNIRVAEMVKYACNAFHGLKVSFANEIGNICKSLAIDSREVMRIFCADTKLNLSSYYLKPGFAFGGSCLPKDIRAVLYRAKQLDVETPVLAAVLSSNRRQIERGVAMVLRTGKRRIGVLGLSFKPGTDDLRESPMVTLVETLIGKGLQLAIYDRDVSSARVLGANREFIEGEIPHIWSLMRDSLADVVEQSEVLVIGSETEEFRALGTSRNGQIIVDLVRSFDQPSDHLGRYDGICW